MGNSVPPKTHSKSSLNGTPKPARKSAEKYATGGVFVPIWVNFDNAVEGVEQATYDLSGIEKNGKKIAVIEEKIGKLDLSGIAVVEKGQKDNSEAIKEKNGLIKEE